MHAIYNDRQHKSTHPDLWPVLRVIQEKVTLGGRTPAQVATNAKARKQQPDQELSVDRCFDDPLDCWPFKFVGCWHYVLDVCEGIHHDSGCLKPAAQAGIPEDDAITAFFCRLVQVWHITEHNADGHNNRNRHNSSNVAQG